MDLSNLEKKLTDKLSDELSGVTMDITSSFLNGRVSSPLLTNCLSYDQMEAVQYASEMTNFALSYASSISQNVQSAARMGIGALSSAGLYITKDGIEFDPSSITGIIGDITQTVVELSMQELLTLRNLAWEKLTYVPDLKSIADKSLSYFMKYIGGGEEALAYAGIIYKSKTKGLISPEDIISSGLGSGDNVNDTDEMEKEMMKDNIKNTLSKVKTFSEEHFIPITKEISNITGKISYYTTEAARWAAFGPEWLTRTILDGTSYYFNIAEKYVDECCYVVNEKKQEWLNLLAAEITKQMCKQYDRIIEKLRQMAFEQIEREEQKLKIEASVQISNSMSKLEAKTGVHIKLPDLTDANALLKIKTNADLAKLMSGTGIL